MLTPVNILLFAAIIITLIHAANARVPLWVPVLLLCILAFLK